MQQDYNKDPALKNIVPEFRKTVQRRMSELMYERIVPRVMPAATVSAAISVPFFLNALEHVSPPMRLVSFIAAATTFASSFFWNMKTPSPIVKRSEAIKSMDDELGETNKEPVRQFDDVPANDLSDFEYTVWVMSKLRIWEEYGEKIKNLSPIKPFKSYYEGHAKSRAVPQAAIFTAAALTALTCSNDLQNKWNTAMDWTSPPAPLVYQVQVTPPQNIDGLNIITDQTVKSAMRHGEILTPHDNSLLTITTYDRPAEITVNGTIIEPQQVQENAGSGVESFEYTFTLSPEITQILIDQKYSLSLDIEPDLAPNVTIRSIKQSESNPSVLEMEYDLGDDYGVTGANARIRILGDEDRQIDPSLETNQLPEVNLPH